MLRDTRHATRDASTRGTGGRARSYRTQWIPEAFDGPGAEVPSSGASRKDGATNDEERNGGKPTASEENLRRNRRSELPFRHQYEPNKDARDDLVVVLTDGIGMTEQVRTAGVRQSGLVCQYGRMLAEQSSKSVPKDELYDVLEQVSIAAMDCGEEDLARRCVDDLEKAFPKSIRVSRLRGMLLEMQGKFELAEEKYSIILERDPQNYRVMKRMCGLAKSRGNVPAAISACIAYLKLNAVDRDAWEELADLYVSQGMCKQAAFCMEEILLLDPFVGASHRKYADILYTLGGNENLAMALQYYSSAIKFSNGKDLRALYGICLCSTHLATAKAYVKKKEEDELHSLSSDLILKMYRARNKNGKHEIVKAVLS